MVLLGGFSPGGYSGIQGPSVLCLCILLGEASKFPSGAFKLGWHMRKESTWETGHFLWIRLRSGSHHFCLNVISWNAVLQPNPMAGRAGTGTLAECLGGKGNRIWQTCSVVSSANGTSRKGWLDNQNPSPWLTIIRNVHTCAHAHTHTRYAFGGEGTSSVQT